MKNGKSFILVIFFVLILLPSFLAGAYLYINSDYIHFGSDELTGDGWPGRTPTNFDCGEGCHYTLRMKAASPSTYPGARENSYSSTQVAILEFYSEGIFFNADDDYKLKFKIEYKGHIDQNSQSPTSLKLYGYGKYLSGSNWISIPEWSRSTELTAKGDHYSYWEITSGTYTVDHNKQYRVYFKAEITITGNGQGWPWDKEWVDFYDGDSDQYIIFDYVLFDKQ
ncbi:MAG: hypothetical protein HeimC3_14230 [Candidatus Heimdallarchaeota archaeon LC_3]|nr:MAG: hypothetical protein HeimC3_14230 [Candidatus Heimdallarchaeota archaeon LC_3]